VSTGEKNKPKIKHKTSQKRNRQKEAKEGVKMK
jgi:hypothetical protein